MMQKQVGLSTVFRKGNDRVSENDREEKKEGSGSTVTQKQFWDLPI
jgi:hypothetical protein